VRGAIAITAAVMLALSAQAPSAAEPTRFASAIEDLPLMAGLEETAAAPFETPQGRIVRVEAAGDVEAPAVALYYAQTLPQLGWRRIDDEPGLVFTRSGERLVVRVDADAVAADGAVTRVAFMITPAVTAARP